MARDLTHALRSLALRTPLRRFSHAFHHYEYMFTPAQLAFLVRCVDETEGVPGAIVEIGCATGRTTVFLNKHLDELRSSRRYVCVDTFSGFTEDDMSFETRQRGKVASALTGFQVNAKEWFDRNLKDNGIDRVKSFESDIKTFDLASAAPRISMCLLDVDLYQPVKVGLAKVLPLLSPGGIVVVDDMIENTTFDGARQAYRDFTRETGRPEEIVLQKLGVVR
jgi:predicted O-methyltransferase YrrM